MKTELALIIFLQNKRFLDYYQFFLSPKLFEDFYLISSLERIDVLDLKNILEINIIIIIIIIKLKDAVLFLSQTITTKSANRYFKNVTRLFLLSDLTRLLWLLL